jgi:hypothetical protein
MLRFTIQNYAGGSSVFEFPAETFEYNEFEDARADLEWEGEVNRRSRKFVRWAQSSLNQIMGLRLVVDGVIGTATRSAIRNFQQRQGLTVDGIVGPQTEAAIKAVLLGQPPAPPRPAPPRPDADAPDIISVRGIRVARRIAPQVEGLLAAAAAAGLQLSGGGWRSRQRQIELRRQHCGTTPYDIYERPSNQCTPPTARPGNSMHEQGLAIDFTNNGELIGSRSNPAFVWLSQNAERFGLRNLPSEPWHWSVNGR